MNMLPLPTGVSMLPLPWQKWACCIYRTEENNIPPLPDVREYATFTWYWWHCCFTWQQCHIAAWQKWHISAFIWQKWHCCLYLTEVTLLPLPERRAATTSAAVRQRKEHLLAIAVVCAFLRLNSSLTYAGGNAPRVDHEFTYGSL